MCINSKLIYNKYIRQMVRCDCGKCETCLQAKASARSNRIRYNVVDGEIALFVTLTYDNRFVPYIEKSDLYRGVRYPEIHRDFVVRRKRKGKSYFFVDKVERNDVVLPSDILIDNYEDIDVSKIKGLKHLPSRVGVCYYEDLKDFIKRLRINYERRFGVIPKFTYFACSEYGGKSQRPHFHLLIFIKVEDERKFRSCIVESWSFADKRRTSKFVEIARDAASYVASYVNGGNSLSALFKNVAIKQKHSYSKGFGTRLECFSLHSVLQKTRSGCLTFYSERRKTSAGSLLPLPLPKYVINRYFPKFKGFSRLPSNKVLNYIYNPEELCGIKSIIDYDDEEIRRICISLDNAKAFYRNVTGLSDFDFCLDYINVWNCFSSTILKLSYYEDGLPISDFTSFYENANEFVNGKVRAPTLELHKLYCVDPNKTKFRLRQESIYKPLFYRMCKQRNVTNDIMSNFLNLNV